MGFHLAEGDFLHLVPFRLEGTFLSLGHGLFQEIRTEDNGTVEVDRLQAGAGEVGRDQYGVPEGRPADIRTGESGVRHQRSVEIHRQGVDVGEVCVEQDSVGKVDPRHGRWHEFRTGIALIGRFHLVAGN